MQPVAPKVAVVVSADKCLGASLFLEDDGAGSISVKDWMRLCALTTPIEFATGTPTLVNMTRSSSSAISSLYHTSSIMLGADVPQDIMKHARLRCCWHSRRVLGPSKKRSSTGEPSIGPEKHLQYATWICVVKFTTAMMTDPMHVKAKPSATKGTASLCDLTRKPESGA